MISSPVKRVLQVAARAVYYRWYRAAILTGCWLSDRWQALFGREPAPPARLRFRVAESLSVSEFNRIGSGCARQIYDCLEKMGVAVRSARILDFGCGCGRTAKWILSAHGGMEYHGVDVDAEAIEWCADHLRTGSFHATKAVPPLPFAPAWFDAVYCLSVFTHLDEQMQDLWLAELSRVLKPAGVLLLTFHGPSAARNLDVTGQTTLGATGFLHRTSTKLKGMVPDWYQTSWHSPEYIVRRMAIWFDDVFYEPVPDGLQDFVIAKGAKQSPD
jgi:SAM-dependent methyltransferase